MHRLALLALAAVAVLPSSAHAASSDGPLGVGCFAYDTPDPTAAPGDHNIVLVGGPVVGSGTLACLLKIDGRVGTGPTVSGHGEGIHMIGPSQVAFNAGSSVVTICTEYDDGTRTYYWDAAHLSWTTTPVACPDTII